MIILKNTFLVSDFSFSVGVLPIVYKYFIIGIYLQNPSLYIFSKNNLGDLKQKTSVIKNINGMRENKALKIIET